MENRPHVGNEKHISRIYHKLYAEVKLSGVPAEKERLIEDLFEEFFDKALRIIGKDISDYETNADLFLQQWDHHQNESKGDSESTDPLVLWALDQKKAIDDSAQEVQES